MDSRDLANFQDYSFPLLRFEAVMDGKVAERWITIKLYRKDVLYVDNRES